MSITYMEWKDVQRGQKFKITWPPEHASNVRDNDDDVMLYAHNNGLEVAWVELPKDDGPKLYVVYDPEVGHKMRFDALELKCWLLANGYLKE